MIYQNLVASVRNLRKNRLYHAINIAGLGLSLSFIILIYLFIHEEFSFDRSYPSSENIFMLQNTIPVGPSKGAMTAILPTAVSVALEQDLGIDASRYKPVTGTFMLNGEKQRENTSFVDKGFLKIFQPKFIFGDFKSALNNKNSIVINESIAKKYFGDIDPVGKFMIWKTEQLVVTGVIDNNSGNSSIQTDILINISNIISEDPSWTQSEVMTFMYWDGPEGVDQKINKIVDAKTEFMKSDLMAAFPEFKGGQIYNLELVPLKDVHFSTANSLLSNRGKIEDSYILIGIAVLILFVACGNYILLSLATSENRSREVGVRKVLGASRGSVMIQFLADSIVLTSISALLAIGLAFIFIGDFNVIVGKNLKFDRDTYLNVFIALSILTIFIGIIAGSYPAVWLSKLNPHAVLSGKMMNTLGTTISQVLSFIQFTICIIFICCSWIMFDQISFVKHKDIGMDVSQLIQSSTLGLDSLDKDLLLDRLRHKLEGKSGIEGVSAISDFPFFATEQIELRPGLTVDVNSFLVDRQWNRIMGVTLVEGHDFADANASDTTERVLINQTLASDLQRKDPIGSMIPGTNYTIVGIVHDFHYQSMADMIAPTYFRLSKNNNEVFFRLSKSANKAQALEAIQEAWTSAVPGRKITYSFLTDSFKSFYEETENWQMLIAYATVYAIIISCMGMFALSGFQAANATKQIVIRKLFGAPSPSLVWLLNRRIVFILCVAFVTSIPLVYHFMNNWLNSYAYRIQWQWYWFAGTFLLGLIIIVLTVSYNVIRATRSNVVSVLRQD